jgi:MinD-like ATPase involved in chromosome partitioning or flagellar assembly
MTAELTFAFVTTVRPWAREWARHVADHGPGRVVDHVAERKCLWDEDYQLLVVDADSELVDRAIAEEAHRRGRSVVAVWDPSDPRTKDLAIDLGADVVVEADASAEEFLRQVAGAEEWEALVPTVTAVRARPVARGQPAQAPAADHVASPAGMGLAGDRPGGAVAVVGGPVGDEAEDVVIELGRWVGHGRKAVVVDANEVTPGLAQHLGLPVLPNIRIAVEAVRDPRRRVSDALLAVPRAGFWLLGGLADPGQWSEVAPTEVADVVARLAAGADVVIAKAGPLAEDVVCHGGPDRFGISRRLLAMADRIIGVGVATPTGLTRLVGWLADVRMVAPRTPVHVALCRAPRGSFRRAELVERVQADTGAASVSLLPFDPGVDKANWNGPRGPFAKAVGGLGMTVFGPPPGRARRGRS